MPFLLPFAMVAAFGLAIIEAICSIGWYSLYFRHGIRLFTKQVPLAIRPMALPTVTDLNEGLKGKWGPSLVFKSLSNTEIAFRERAFEFTFFNSTPVMHGLIRYYPLEGQLEVIGYLNWTVLSFLGIALGFLFVPHMPPFLFFAFLALISLCYFMQLKRFDRVVAYLGERSKTIA